MNAMQAAIHFHLAFDNESDVTEATEYTPDELAGIRDYLVRYKGDDTFLLSVGQALQTYHGLSLRQRQYVVRKMIRNFRAYFARVQGIITVNDQGEFVLTPTLPTVAFAPADAGLPMLSGVAAANVTPHVSATLTGGNATAGSVLQCGIYTVELPGQHVTLKILPMADKPGITHIVSVLVGPDNGKDYHGFAWIKDGNVASPWQRTAHLTHAATALRQLLDGGASLAAAHCNRCGRLLTVPASLYAGMGPECAKK